MTRLTGSPAVLLHPHHLAEVRQVLAANPGVSLRTLCPKVARACQVPRVNVATLARFIERYDLQRVLPAGAITKLEARLRSPLYRQMLDECGPLLAQLVIDPKRWQQLKHDIDAAQGAEA